jgi:CelD/BcsL family acetyltransferase involved in cellulose biosynthesis
MEAAPALLEDEISTAIAGGEICASLEVVPGMERLEAMWRDLEGRADITFFLSWDWIGTWLVESGAQPLLMVARRQSQIVALGLLQFKARRVGPIKFDSLFLHQSGEDDLDCIAIEFNDFLLDRGCQSEARLACVKELLRVRRAGALRWRELHWAGAPCDLVHALSVVDIRAQMYRTAPSPWLDIAMLRSEGTDYLEFLGRSTRYSIRRSMRLYEDQWGPLSISTAGSIEEGMRWLEELRKLHQAHWVAKGKLGAFGNPFFGRFLRKLIDRPSNQHVDLLRICAGDTPIGYLCNFVYGGSVMNYQSGFLYNPDGRYKPGLVSHVLAIWHYIEKRLDMREYSFLAGDAQYKRSLSTSAKQLNWYVISPR